MISETSFPGFFCKSERRSVTATMNRVGVRVVFAADRFGPLPGFEVHHVRQSGSPNMSLCRQLSGEGVARSSHPEILVRRKGTALTQPSGATPHHRSPFPLLRPTTVQWFRRGRSCRGRRTRAKDGRTGTAIDVDVTP